MALLCGHARRLTARYGGFRPGQYVLEHSDLFPGVGVVEDPHVWLDVRGRFHALFHHETGCPTTPWGGKMNCGGHAFSLDGRCRYA